MFYAGDECYDDDITSGPLEEMHDLAGDKLAERVDIERKEQRRAGHPPRPWHGA